MTESTQHQDKDDEQQLSSPTNNKQQLLPTQSTQQEPRSFFTHEQQLLSQHSRSVAPLFPFLLYQQSREVLRHAASCSGAAFFSLFLSSCFNLQPPAQTRAASFQASSNQQQHSFLTQQLRQYTEAYKPRIRSSSVAFCSLSSPAQRTAARLLQHRAPLHSTRLRVRPRAPARPCTLLPRRRAHTPSRRTAAARRSGSDGNP
jgi:hypothetical protein